MPSSYPKKKIDPEHLRLRAFARRLSLREIERRLGLTHPALLAWLVRGELPRHLLGPVAKLLGLKVGELRRDA